MINLNDILVNLNSIKINKFVKKSLKKISLDTMYKGSVSKKSSLKNRGLRSWPYRLGRSTHSGPQWEEYKDPYRGATD